MTRSAPARVRNPQATRARILEAAREEFAGAGLGGARVDNIAEQAQANKRMIYHYFGSKEALFAAVVEDAYLRLRAAEQALELDNYPPMEALEKLVRFTWQYYLDHPEFLTLINSENLHKGRHLQGSEALQRAQSGLIHMVARLIERGVRAGVFRSGIDVVQLNITIAAIGYYYLTNRFTGSILFQRDMMSQERLRERVEFNLETIRRLVAA